MGSLRALLDSHGDMLITRPDIQLRLAFQIADGMAYLHGREPPVIHHDLKSLNILCFSTSGGSKLSVGMLEGLLVKICDFGLATGLASSAATMLQSTNRNGGAMGGTFAYCAPEYFDEGIYTPNSEVYSYGIIVSELLTAQVPWSAPDPRTGRAYTLKALQLAVSRGVRPELPKSAESQVLAQLAKDCWQGEAKDRPSFEQIVYLLRKSEELSSDATDGTVEAPRKAGTSSSHAKMHQTLGGRIDPLLCSHKDYTEAAAMKSFGPSAINRKRQPAATPVMDALSSDSVRCGLGADPTLPMAVRLPPPQQQSRPGSSDAEHGAQTARERRQGSLTSRGSLMRAKNQQLAMKRAEEMGRQRALRMMAPPTGSPAGEQQPSTASAEKPIRLFLSYRVDADGDLVERMFDKLRALNVDVWWDKACLKPGEPWEAGFADGLLGSDVFVPFLSRAALAPFSKLKAGSRCDNVFLEYRLALELKARGVLSRIFPVFIGEIEEVGSLGEGYGDFFRGGGMPAAPELWVKAVEAKVTEHLERASQGITLLPKGQCTVKRTLGSICEHQGEFLRGAPRRDAMEKVVAALAALGGKGPALNERADEQLGDPAREGLPKPSPSNTGASAAGATNERKFMQSLRFSLHRSHKEDGNFAMKSFGPRRLRQSTAREPTSASQQASEQTSTTASSNVPRLASPSTSPNNATIAYV